MRVAVQNAGICLRMAISDKVSILKAHLRIHDRVLTRVWIRVLFSGNRWGLGFLVINLGLFLIFILSGTSRFNFGLLQILHKIVFVR